MTPGIHLLHKPVGSTSFSFVQREIEAQRAARPQSRPRVCHGGALDPFAQGLLLLLVGPATRLFEHLHAAPKVYEATVRWGVETDNGDPTGRAVFVGDASGVTEGRLEEAVAGFVGWHEQTPPATSNKRVGGERAYVRAHRGETVEMPPSRVYLHEGQWVGHDLSGVARESRLRVVVRGGYYVRALARDLGRLVGCGAHLPALRRTAIGPWEDPGEGRTVAVQGRDLLPWAPARDLTDHEVGELRAGRSIGAGVVTPADWTMPAGFPETDAPVRGMHLNKLAFLLRPEGDVRLAALATIGA